MFNRGRKASAGSYVGPITINSITSNLDGTAATISFTHNLKGRNSLFYQASTTGASSGYGSSPLTISGLTSGTSYIFNVVASSASGVINTSSVNSGSTLIQQQSYSLSQTFSSSGTFTVPAGITQIAVKGIGAGGTGANGLNSDGGSGAVGGRGGGGGGGFIFKNYSVTPGQTFSVSIGSAGQNTSFGSLATATSGSSSGGGGVSATIGLEASSNGPGGGSGGTGGGYSYNYGTPSGGQSGNPGSSGATLNSSAPGVGSITLGGSGGGGGGGAVGSTNGPASGGQGGNPGSSAGRGGNGGSGAQPGSGGGTSSGSVGSAATGRGAGGGGGGGGALSRDSGTGGGTATQGGTGGAGQPGIIYVYVR
jgi:trimeric autotransporter adhesin